MAKSFLVNSDVTSGLTHKPDEVLYFKYGWAEFNEICYVGVFGDALQYGDVILAYGDVTSG